jgi:hypothetical protein
VQERHSEPSAVHEIDEKDALQTVMDPKGQVVEAVVESWEQSAVIHPSR